MDDGVEQEVKILDMGSRMAQVTLNIRNATLSELKANGLINTTDENLTKTIPGNAKSIGEMTMEEAINAIAAYLP